MQRTSTLSRRATWTALLFTIVFPSLLTFMYFVVLAGQAAAVQQVVYAAGKVIQFGFPAVWVFLIVRSPIRWQRPTGKGILPGLIFGALVAFAMVGLYHGMLKPMGFFVQPAEMVRGKLIDLGLSDVATYAAVGVFYALCHSLLEEYYWRWFVFGQLRQLVRPSTAILVSSLGFMAHHVILLATYFGWLAPQTYLFALGVAVGGAVWAWIYHRSQSLYGPWLSHCLIDAAIFIVGYDMARDLLTG
jgi:membrane protease YdiL (CAAX protease family)